MAILQESSRRMLLALALVLVAAPGCAAPASCRNRPLEKLLASHDETAARRWFLDLLRSNGAEKAFVAAMSRLPIGPRHYEIETVRTMPGCNGLVYVQIRPDPDEIPGLEAEFERCAPPERFWFFFDRQGNLLTWSDLNGGTWLVEDVTGEGTKDLLVSRGKGLGPPQDAEALPVCYTFFSTSRPGASGISFGRNFEWGISNGFTLIHLRDSSIPLVMTLEDRNPLEEKQGARSKDPTTEAKVSGENEHADWFGTVVRTFKGGEPRVILVVSGRLQLCTDPGGEVFLQPVDKDKKYRLPYNFVRRRFESEWLEAGEEGVNLDVEFSANVPR